MDWSGEEDIQSKLKDIPKFKMSEWSAEQIKSNLKTVSVKPQKSRKGITALKSVGVALSGAAVAAIVLTNLPSHHLSNVQMTTGAGGSSSSTANATSSPSTVSGTNTTSGTQNTQSTHNTQSGATASNAPTPYSYFGIKTSLNPMIPAALAKGYQTKASEISVINRDPSSTFFRGDRYSALYVDPTSQAKVQVTEVVGNSISDYTEGANNTTVSWQTTKQINGQMYYIHPASSQPADNSNIVGFVRDNVVYEFASSQLSTDALLTLVQGELQPAQVNVAYRYAGQTYSLAVNNITFKPLMLPNSLSSQWQLYTIGSGLTKTSDHSGFQDVVIEYHLANNSNQLIDVMETPLQDVSQVGLGHPMYSANKTWNDYNHGLEIQVSGNIPQAQLNQIVSAMQASK